MLGLPSPGFYRSLGFRRVGILGDEVTPWDVAVEAARAARAGLKVAEQKLSDPAGLAWVYIEEWELRAWLLPGVAIVIASPREPPRGLVIVESLAASRLHAEADMEECERAGARTARGRQEDLEMLIESALLAHSRRKEAAPPSEAKRTKSTVKCTEKECRALMEGCLNLYANLVRHGMIPRGIEGLKSKGLVVFARGGEYACTISADRLPGDLPRRLRGCPYILIIARKSGVEVGCLRDLGEVIEALESLEGEFAQAPG